MIYVEFMKNILLADSSELLALRLILTSCAQKRLIPNFQKWCTSIWWKIFFWPIRASSWLLDSFRPPEPKKVWFPLSGHDVRRVHGKFFSRRFGRAMGYEFHFGLLSPKTFYSLLSWNDLRRVHEKFSCRRFERAIGCEFHFGLLSPKTFDSHFIDMMYVELMKNFLLADSSKLMAVRLVSASWAQKLLIPTFLTWCPSSSRKIFFSPIWTSRWLLD